MTPSHGVGNPPARDESGIPARELDGHHAAGIPISMDLGKHPNDEMVSFYSRSPSGFDVEIGCGGRLIDDATWMVTEITKPSMWGPRSPA